ncbi:MAG: hypothetical protein RXQ96_08700 [Thermocladium sp.]
MRGNKGEGEVITVIIIIGLTIALAILFYIIASRNFGSAMANSVMSSGETLFLNIATDLDGSLSNTISESSLSYAIPPTNLAVINIVNNYCLLYINGTLYSESAAVIFGASPSLVSAPAGFRVALLGNNSIISFNRTSSIFNVNMYGYGTINGVTYGEYIVLYPKISIFNANSTYHIPVNSTYHIPVNSTTYYIYVPTFKAGIHYGFHGLLNFNVTGYRYSSLYVKEMTIEYRCGAGTQSIDGEIELNSTVMLINNKVIELNSTVMLINNTVIVNE